MVPFLSWLLRVAGRGNGILGSQHGISQKNSWQVLQLVLFKMVLQRVSAEVASVRIFECFFRGISQVQYVSAPREAARSKPWIGSLVDVKLPVWGWVSRTKGGHQLNFELLVLGRRCLGLRWKKIWGKKTSLYNIVQLFDHCSTIWSLRRCTNIQYQAKGLVLVKQRHRMRMLVTCPHQRFNLDMFGIGNLQPLRVTDSSQAVLIS